jgi:hypothetical protein
MDVRTHGRKIGIRFRVGDVRSSATLYNDDLLGETREGEAIVFPMTAETGENPAAYRDLVFQGA